MHAPKEAKNYIIVDTQGLNQFCSHWTTLNSISFPAKVAAGLFPDLICNVKGREPRKIGTHEEHPKDVQATKHP